jgi:hypothetical protein
MFCEGDKRFPYVFSVTDAGLLVSSLNTSKIIFKETLLLYVLRLKITTSSDLQYVSVISMLYQDNK